ncbi:hypothetical protein ACHWQZ_G018275 [Mnemiopsis leidyi]
MSIISLNFTVIQAHERRQCHGDDTGRSRSIRNPSISPSSSSFTPLPTPDTAEHVSKCHGPPCDRTSSLHVCHLSRHFVRVRLGIRNKWKYPQVLTDPSPATVCQIILDLSKIQVKVSASYSTEEPVRETRRLDITYLCGPQCAGCRPRDRVTRANSGHVPTDEVT